MQPPATATFETMRQVCVGYQAGGMILPDVLALAERVRRAGLEPDRGTIVVATLEGDVHHIGKSLLVALLAAAGYRVIDLGKQVPVATIVDAVVASNAQAVGLSALLVSTSKQMPRCVQALDARGVHVPVLLGGAAINRAFGRRAGVLPDGRVYEPGVFYCRDVFEGLATLEALHEPRARAALLARARAEMALESGATSGSAATAAAAGTATAAAAATPPPPSAPPASAAGSPTVTAAGDALRPPVVPASSPSAPAPSAGAPASSGGPPVPSVPAASAPEQAMMPHAADRVDRAGVRACEPPKPPYWGARPVAASLAEVWAHLDRNTLFRHHWGGYQARGAEYGRVVHERFEPALARLEAEAVRDDWLDARIVAGYWPCRSEGDSLLILDPRDPTSVLTRLDFPRQPDGEGLCLADYFSPVQDLVAFQAVSVGRRAGAYVEALQRAGEYVHMLEVNGLASATTEALAEYAHAHARADLGLPPTRSLRFSWGYPACPDLEEQRKVLPLLEAERYLGLTLTSSGNLDPEHSTVAMIVHHPDVKYFAVRTPQ